MPGYWNLLPLTPDIHLRKVLRENATLAQIIKEWRSKWQTSSRWTLAEIDQLIDDMKSDNSSVRFQAVVVLARAVEKIQIMVDKLSKFYF
jgi:hypothetical protein